MEEFDRLEQVTQRVLRCALLGIPVWLVLLVLIPQTGLGALPSLTLATLCTVGVVVVSERRRGRVGTPPRSESGRSRRPMGPLTAAALTLGGVVLFIYVIFVIRVAVGGG